MASFTGVVAPAAAFYGGHLLPRTLRLPTLVPSRVPSLTRITASSSHNNPIRSIATGALFLSATAAALLSARSPARAEPPSPPVTEEVAAGEASSESEPSFFSQLLDSIPDALFAFRTEFYQKLKGGEYSELLSILNFLSVVQPSKTEWKFLAARLLNEMGKPAESRKLFEEILAADPLSFEALFENAVLMDRCGEGPAAIERLERALDPPQAEGREKTARDVRLIMAQIQFLQKNVEDALTSYEELAKEDPNDYRPYFCQGVIYSLLERNKEAREKFAKYHELSPRIKFEEDAYLLTPLSRMKLFRTGDGTEI